LPSGPVRMVAGAVALNGLLLVGWSAPYTHLAMERFWNGPGVDGASGSGRGDGDVRGL
jgi:hypothetical protein